MSIEEKLTEEDKEFILNEVERERRKKLVTKLIEEGINSGDEDVLTPSIKLLGILKKFDLKKYEELLTKVRKEIDRFGNTIYKPIIKMININLTEYPEKHYQELNKNNEKIEMDLEYYNSLINNRVSDKKELLRIKNTEQFKLLKKTHKKCAELTEKGMNDENAIVRRNAIEKLRTLAKINPKKYEELIEKGMNDADMIIRAKTAQTLVGLAILNSKKYNELFKQGIEDRNGLVRAETVKTLTAIAQIDSKKYEELYKQGINDKYVVKETVETLELLSLTLQNKRFIKINNSKHKFLKEYLNSKFIYKHNRKLKEKKQIIYELTTIINENKCNYTNMTSMIKRNNITNLDDFLECGSIQTTHDIINKLGEGASGQTYLIFHKEYDREMAMKLIPTNKYDMKEAKILSELKHKHIVDIRGIETNIKKEGKETYTIIMEYIKGKTLEKIMKKNPNGLSVKKIMKYSQQLLNAIEYMDKKHKFHRDLNLNNIIIEEENDNLKIIDFGIATDDDNEPRDNRKYGGPNDIFSWGLITYKLATGKHLTRQENWTKSSKYYADRIKELKIEIRKDDGTINETYKTKIINNTPKQLQQQIITALENKEKQTNEKQLALFKESYEPAQLELFER